jgi:hypothetical protein
MLAVRKDTCRWFENDVSRPADLAVRRESGRLDGEARLPAEAT